MQTEQLVWRAASGWSPYEPGTQLGDRAHLVLAFGGGEACPTAAHVAELRAAYPGAVIAGGSTAGEIYGTRVEDDTLVATAISFEHTRVRAASLPIPDAPASREVGRRVVEQLPREELAHVLVVSSGLNVNGSELVAGIIEALPPGCAATGGLAADGARFASTQVFLNDAPQKNAVVAIGLYGKRLRVAYGSRGGWDPFGPERLITRARGNVLLELDGRSALELYKSYLGPYAAGLPGSALLFPLLIRSTSEDRGVVRTVLAVDEAAGSMTFAGDVPTGQRAQLMRANFDRLIDGAQGAAALTMETLTDHPPEFALLVSCVGRKMVLKQRTEEEVEAVRDLLGPQAVLAGFYSYGEISPQQYGEKCDLHNQTMTITTLSES